MKNRIVLASKFLIMGFLIVGCSTGSDSNCPEDFVGALSSEEEAIVGTWVLTDIVSEEAKDLTDDDVDNPSTEIFDQLSDCNKDIEYLFNSDRAFTLKQGYNADNCSNKFMLNGSWKYVNGQMSFVQSCNTNSVDIFLNNELTVFTIEDVLTFNEVDGTVSTSNVTLTYTKSL